MSFQQFARGGAGAGGPGTRAGGPGVASSSSEPAPPPTGRSEAQELSGRVFRLTNSITAYKRMVDQIGSDRDTEDFRRSLSHQGEAIAEDARSVNEALKHLVAPLGLGVPQHSASAQADKLLSDFRLVLADFQRAQRLCADREAGCFPRRAPREAAAPLASKAAESNVSKGRNKAKQSRPLAKGGAGVPGQEGAPAAEPSPAVQLMTQQASLAQEISFNEALIEERDRGIAEIQQSIAEVNEIFRDLAVLVREQGEQIDDLEANLIKTEDRTRDAGDQLTKAARSSKSSRSQLCIILALTVALTVILLILLT